jgi:CheY-like chemotaxis protein
VEPTSTRDVLPTLNPVVLVVDDDDVLRAVASGAVESAGFSVREALELFTR